MVIIIRTQPGFFCYRTIKNPVDFVLDMIVNFYNHNVEFWSFYHLIRLRNETHPLMRNVARENL